MDTNPLHESLWAAEMEVRMHQQDTRERREAMTRLHSMVAALTAEELAAYTTYRADRLTNKED